MVWEREGRCPNRLYGEVGMDSLRCGKTDGGEGIREGDEIPRDEGWGGKGRKGGSRTAPTVSQGGRDGFPPLREKRMGVRVSVRGTIFHGNEGWGG